MAGVVRGRVKARVPKWSRKFPREGDSSKVAFLAN